MKMNGTSALRARFSQLVLLALIAGCGAQGDSAPRIHQIAIQGFVYAPASLEVAVGDTVVWTNRDVVPHTVTSQSGAFDSGSMAAGATWRYVAVEPGSFPYICGFHPTMKGMLVVR